MIIRASYIWSRPKIQWLSAFYYSAEIFQESNVLWNMQFNSSRLRCINKSHASNLSTRLKFLDILVSLDKHFVRLLPRY